jgi:hypothetical protein
MIEQNIILSISFQNHLNQRSHETVETLLQSTLYTVSNRSSILLSTQQEHVSNSILSSHIRSECRANWSSALLTPTPGLPPQRRPRLLCSLKSKHNGGKPKATPLHCLSASSSPLFHTHCASCSPAPPPARARWKWPS